jgi:hypothetical protein
MEKEGLDAVAVYGDEYRKESLRYVTGFWPIFERGMCFIPRTGEPVLACAPEGEVYAKEMSVWPNYVNVKDFACVSVPDAIDYPNAVFSSFKEILSPPSPEERCSGSSGCGICPRTSSSAYRRAGPAFR